MYPDKYEWTIEGNKYTFSFENMKAIISLSYNNGCNLLIIRDNEQLVSKSFRYYGDAMLYAEDFITKYFCLKDVMKKNGKIYLKEK